MKTIKFWLVNGRYHALFQSFLPALLAMSMAAGKEGFSVFYAALAIAGALTGHLAINLLDDFMDYRHKKTDYRNQMANEGMRARIAKCPYIISGEVSLKKLFTVICLLSSIALAIGFVIYIKRGEPILYIALAAAVLGYSYSGKPLSLSYHGLGEIQVGIMFGPMLMCGVYYAAVGYLEPSIVFVSIPVGILVANILYAHSIMDFEPDKKAGKVTLAVLLEKREKMLSLCATMLILAYLSIAYALGAGYLPKRYAVVFISVPLAAALYKSLRRYVQNPSEVPAKRFWMGPMGHWERISAAGIQWFMIRWFMARNLLSLFCILIIIVNCLVKN